MWTRRFRRDESGQAVVAAIGVSFVVAALITTMLALGVHTNDATVRDRSRAQGIQAAEAAVSLMMNGLTRGVCVADVGMASPTPMTVQGKVVGQYQAMVRLPSEAGSLNPVLWDPNQPSSAGCTTSPPSTQERVVTAWGYGPNATSDRKVTRKIEVVVRVAPMTGFRFTCFAGGTSPLGVLEVTNNMTAVGDCYARTISATKNNLVTTGNLISPGPITIKNNAVFQSSVWAGGALVVGENTTIMGNAISAQSSVALNENVDVLGNVTAATTITLDNNATIAGTRCPASAGAPGCPTSLPPTLSLPSLKCATSDFACWAAIYPGMVSYSSSQLSAWLTNNKNDIQGNFFLNDSGTVDFKGGGTITGPLTIVTNGKVQLSRDLVTPDPALAPASCRPAGGPTTCTVAIVSTAGASDAIHLYAPRFTASSTISMLLYTSGTIEIDSGCNPTTFNGVLYGGSLDIESNGITPTQSQDLINFPPPFVDWTLASSLLYTAMPLSWREVTPQAP